MDLYLKWNNRIPLIAVSSGNGIYDVALDRIPEKPGIYIFLRVHGTKKHEALYVGKATSLKSRIKQQLNNAKLMTGIMNSPNGSRTLVFGEFIAKPGQQLDKSLLRIEHALMRHYLAIGDQLLNVKGARIVKDSLTSERPELKSFIPSTIYFEK